MRPAALVCALFFAACSSSDVDETFHDCDPGGDVSVDALIDIPGVAMENVDDQLTMHVVVGNNSHSEIEVRAIRVEPGYTAQRRYSLSSSYRKFGRVLAPGEDYAFPLPIIGRGHARGAEVNREATIEMIVSVYLASGDNYRCSLAVAAPR